MDAGTLNLIKSYKGIRNTGMDMFSKMMEDAMSLYSGNKAVTDMPYWGKMEAGYNDMFSKQLKQLYEQFSSRGISGGALASIMGNAGDLNAKGIGNLIEQAYQQAMGGGQTAWNSFLSMRNPNMQAAMKPEEKGGGFNWQSLIPIVGSVLGSLVAPGVGTAVGGAAGGAISGAIGGYGEGTPYKVW